MKRYFSLMLLLATMLTFTACGGDEPDMSYLTEQQKAVLPSLYGTFISTIPLTDWTTTIEFLEQYHPAKDAFDPNLNMTIPEYIHGKLRRTDYTNGHYYYYEYYYSLNNNATKIYMGKDINSWENIWVYDFRYVDNNEFNMRLKGDAMWDIYTRKN